MALQVKKYSKTSNTYTLELTVTENSTSTPGNSSSITYVLKLKSSSKNFAQYGVGAEVKFDNRQVGYRDRKTAPQVTLNTYSEVTLLSGTVVIDHETDGSKSMDISYSLDMASASYTPGPMSDSDTMTLTKIPRGATITDAPNFTDEDNPVVKVSNPAGVSVQLGIYRDSTHALADYRTISGTSYTFNLTQAERDAMRKVDTTKNTAQVRFYVKSTVGDQTFITYLTRTLTIKNPAPTLSPVVVDVNPTTVELTGDPNTMVRFCSNAEVEIGAVGVKFATISSKSVSCGGKVLNGDGTINGVESGDFKISATDSRGNTTTETLSKKVIKYLRPTCNMGEGLPDANGNFDFSVSGEVFTGSFGLATNTLEVYGRYRIQGDSSWGEWASMDVQTDESTYSAMLRITGLDYTSPYEFQARCVDRLTTIETPAVTLSATPHFAWGKRDFKFFVPLYIQGVKYVPDVQPNLLINPLFRVNQRGGTTYTITTPTYTLDGWKSSGSTTDGTVWVGGTYAKLDNYNGAMGLGQYVENYQQLAGKTVTLSFLVEIVSGTYKIAIDDGIYSTGPVLGPGTLQLYSFSTVISTSPDRLRCVLDSDGVASARIYAAKLEVGDHQTLAAVDANGDWQLFEQPDPLEYLKCYRYQFIPWIGDNSYPLGTGFAMGTTSARIIIPCPVRMRMESPEMGFLDGTSWSGLSIFNNGTARPPTGISGVKSTPTGIGINLVTSGLVGNRSCVLRRTDARIIFDANL